MGESIAKNRRKAPLCAEKISALCGAGFFRVTAVERISSTNEALCRRAAGEALPEGTVLCAAEQTAGRGSHGRSFFSPSGTGIYASLLLRPDKGADFLELTALAAVAAAETVESVCGEQARIKWVNDVLLRGRKCCGILASSSLCADSGAPAFVVLGFGINVSVPPEGFPEELRERAGAVLPADAASPFAREELCAKVLSRILHHYRGSKAETLHAYRARSAILGKNILVVRGEEEKQARAIEIDDAFRLLVEYEDGTKEALSFGEVSIR